MAKKKKASAKKSPAKKAPAKKAPKKTAAPTIASLLPMPGFAPVTATQPGAVPATVNVTFIAGVGQLTASLFRNGMLINMQSISTSHPILLSDIRAGDGLAIVGVCAGTTTIQITSTTSPATPETLPAGPFHRSYIFQ